MTRLGQIIARLTFCLAHDLSRKPVPIPDRGRGQAFRDHALDLIRAGLFAAFEQLDRVTRHDGRNRVLVDELRMPIPAQQHAEIIEPGHDALQLDPVDQKYGERDFAFSDVIEKGILQVLSAFGCHGRFPFFARVVLRESLLPWLLRR